jgi:hypothetical protein
VGHAQEASDSHWKIYKWKARLNADGSKQEHGIYFWETYAPVATLISIRIILCMAALNR